MLASDKLEWTALRYDPLASARFRVTNDLEVELVVTSRLIFLAAQQRTKFC